MSGAGKSLLCAGLCRILRQDGLRVAPFKSQNMALNSCVAADGGELGRAQAAQAEAAGVPPDVRMNPILLKPSSDAGSQVILNGRPLGNLSARDYYRRKRDFLPDILRAYESLAAEFDVIVVEGAGSPVELNLRENDIVNMGLAELVDAPVLLAGDIDRGGIFAQLYGTVALLEPSERRRVKGLLVNKFRGDRAILEPGLRMLEEKCGVPVAGVIPWVRAELDDEDSLTDRFRRPGGPGPVEVTVVRLPRISNFTDFSPFSRRPEVSLRYADRPEALGTPDLLLLPGTKSTLSDLAWLRETGLAERIITLAKEGTPVLGICGGFQMLGTEISDPEGVEAGSPASAPGLGLLPVETVFAREKVQRRASGVFAGAEGLFSCLNGLPWTGYELHNGRSATEPPPLTARGGVCGTYLHGLFDAPGVCAKLVESLCRRKGVPFLGPLPSDNGPAWREEQYELLAAELRKGLDMDLLYRVLRREV